MFNSIQENTVNEFLLHSFNLSGIVLQDHQPLALSFGQNKTILIDTQESGISLSILVEKEEHLIETSLFTLLTLCHFKHQLQPVLKPGYLQNDRITLSTFLSNQELTLPNLIRSLDSLNSTIDKATEGSF